MLCLLSEAQVIVQHAHSCWLGWTVVLMQLVCIACLLLQCDTPLHLCIIPLRSALVTMPQDSISKSQETSRGSMTCKNERLGKLTS